MRKNYLWYQFFRYGVVRPALNLFYSECTVSGTEHIPGNKPVIFVPNHQNAFIDALHVVCNTRVFIHFLTRAEPFEVPLAGPFLRSLNMLPVYRVRDGFSSVRKTEGTFEQCYEYLRQGDSVLVFAEANHDLKRRVRPLSKGFTRIAFGAEERYNWKLDLQVIPVGLNYGQHRKSRTPVHVEFGECIPVSNYRKLFLEDERRAAVHLKEATSDGMKKVTMHVSNLRHYPLYHLLLDELEGDRNNLLRPRKVNQRVSIIERHFDQNLLEEARKLLSEAATHDLRLHNFVLPRRVRLKDILLSPFYLFSLVNNILPYQIVRWLTAEYIEDHVFDASAKFLSGLFLLPLYYLTVSLILGSAEIPFPILALYFFISLLTAPLFVKARDLLSGNSFEKLKEEKPELYNAIKSKAERFIGKRNNLFDDCS